MIDVEAVCEAWRRLGGEVEDVGDGRDYDLHVFESPKTDGDTHAAHVPEGAAYLYTDPDNSSSTRFDTTAEALAALPALAKAWGISDELTWEEAAALWVSWGGVSHAKVRGEQALPLRPTRRRSSR